MISFRMRPGYRHEVAIPHDVVLGRFRQRFVDPGSPCRGSVAGEVVQVSICERQRHFWSPKLDLHVSAEGDGSRLEGRFAPRSEVWTLFVALYAALAFTALGFTMFGFSQMIVDAAPWGFGVVGGTLVGAFAVYGAALVGQSLGEDQMHILSSFVEAIVTDAPMPVTPCSDASVCVDVDDADVAGAVAAAALAGVTDEDQGMSSSPDANAAAS